MAQIASDNFPTDALSLGANWTPTVNNGFQIVGGQAQNKDFGASGGTEDVEVYTGAGWTGGADQYAEVKAVDIPSGCDAGPVVRAATAAETFYLFDVIGPLGASATHTLFWVNAAAFTPIGTWVGTVNLNDILRVEAEGSTIRAKVNGTTVITATNANIASGNPGMFAFVPSGGTTNIFDDFAAGDFSAGGGGGTSAIMSVSQLRGHRPGAFKP